MRTVIGLLVVGLFIYFICTSKKGTHIFAHVFFFFIFLFSVGGSGRTGEPIENGGVIMDLRQPFIWA